MNTLTTHWLTPRFQRPDEWMADPHVLTGLIARAKETRGNEAWAACLPCRSPSQGQSAGATRAAKTPRPDFAGSAHADVRQIRVGPVYRRMIKIPAKSAPLRTVLVEDRMGPLGVRNVGIGAGAASCGCPATGPCATTVCAPASGDRASTAA
jgi:hypothetical protein